MEIIWIMMNMMTRQVDRNVSRSSQYQTTSWSLESLLLFKSERKTLTVIYTWYLFIVIIKIIRVKVTGRVEIGTCTATMCNLHNRLIRTIVQVNVSNVNK